MSNIQTETKVIALVNQETDGLFRPRFLRLLMLEVRTEKNEKVAEVISRVISVLDGWIETREPDYEAAKAARKAAADVKQAVWEAAAAYARAAEWEALRPVTEAAAVAEAVAKAAASNAWPWQDDAKAAARAAEAGIPWERIADCVIEALRPTE